MSPCTDVTIELDSLKIGRTNIVKNKSFSLGGKGLNVAVGVARLGFESHVTGLMYEENGYLFENALREEDVPYSFIWNKGSARENYKFIDRKAMLTEVNDVGEEITKESTSSAFSSEISSPMSLTSVSIAFLSINL
jgi:fructose-1-phosphate kinase PfkB-like protein